MKDEMIEKLRSFKAELLKLKKEIDSTSTAKISIGGTRKLAEKIANRWTEEIRSPLEHKLNCNKEVIANTSEEIKKLFILSRPNNLKTSYLKCILNILKNYDNKFILPIQQISSEINDIDDLNKLLSDITNLEESQYLKEAIDCASAGFLRASIVMSWYTAIDKLQKYVIKAGYDKINNESTKMKNKTTGKYKHWNKTFDVHNIAELQTIFDSDLILILESMGVFDGNQSQRLNICFQYRNNCAHPGAASMEPAHLIFFYRYKKYNSGKHRFRIIFTPSPTDTEFSCSCVFSDRAVIHLQQTVQTKLISNCGEFAIICLHTVETIGPAPIGFKSCRIRQD